MKEFFKNLGRYKVSSTLNILGLGIAFAAVYAILVQVYYDLSFNSSIKDADRIVRIDKRFYSWGEDKWFATMPDPLGLRCGDDELVESFGRMQRKINWNSDGTIVINLEKDNQRHPVKVEFAKGTVGILNTLGFKIVAGSTYNFENTGGILLSEQFANIHNLQTGDIIYVGDRGIPVNGIFKDFPRNSDFYGIQLFNCISNQSLNTSEGNEIFYWYYKLKDAKMKDAFLKNAYIKFHESDKIRGNAEDTTTLDDYRNKIADLRITSLDETYFSTCNSELKAGNRSTTNVLLAFAGILLIIAFINFINFFMAMVPRRIRRVNTEKIFGCPTWRLRISFVLEAIGLVLLALLLAAFIVFMTAPEFNMTRLLSVPVDLHENVPVVLITLGAGILLAIVASLYPTYYITSVPPAFAIKGSFGNTAAGRRLRYALLGLQFFISLSLITCSLFINKQYRFFMDYDIGINREHLLCTEVPVGLTYEANRNNFTQMLKENPMIQEVAYTETNLIAESRQRYNCHAVKEDKSILFQMQPVTWDFLQLMDIDITEGRDFEKQDEQAPTSIFIFNETARKQYDIGLDTEITYHMKPAKILGFCEDIHFRPLQYEQMPLAFTVIPDNWGRGYPHLYIRTVPGVDVEAVEAHVRECVGRLAPNAYLDNIKVRFFYQELGEEYEKEKKANMLITAFSLISILIALMGVFGLVFFETQYRRREIALRRVHGAQISEILRMFVMQYARMVGVAFLFAVPVSYLIMSRWLEGYAYHIPLYWWVFALALLVVLIVTSAIVLARSWKAARENPVNALYKE